MATFTAALAALTTIFRPPCETSWLITTTKVPSQDPPFPTAGPSSCDPPRWAANLEDPGFQYYSPAICPSGFAVGPRCQIRDARTNEGFPAITEGETAVYCVPSGFTCTSDTTDFRGGVWGVAGRTNGPANRITVTVAPAMQIRWREADLAILQTHPLTPGLVLLTPPGRTAPPSPPGPTAPPGPAPPPGSTQPPGEPSTVQESSTPATSPPVVPQPTTAPDSTQPGRTDDAPIMTLTSTAGPGVSFVPPPVPPSTPSSLSSQSTRSQLSQSPSSPTRSTTAPIGTTTASSTATQAPGGSALPDGSNMGTSDGPARTFDWRVWAGVMVIAVLLVVTGVMVFVCILLRRNKPNDPWSRFMRSPVGRFFLRLRNVLLASPPGMWLQKRAAQVGQSAAGGWVKARWARIRPAPRPPPESPSDKVYDIEYGMPDTPIVAELDANQRIGSPGNPAELDGSPRWSPLRWSRSSASSTSFGVVSRVKTWLVASTQPKSGWTKSFRQSKFDSDGRDRPTSFKSSRPTSEKSTYSLRGSADWGLASPASLKVPTAAHITRAHERNNSLADVLDAGAKSKAANDKGKEPEVAAQSFSPLLPPDADVMNRLSAGTFGAGRASQVMEAESTHTTEPVPPWPLRDTLPSSPAQFSSGRRKADLYINKS